MEVSAVMWAKVGGNNPALKNIAKSSRTLKRRLNLRNLDFFLAMFLPFTVQSPRHSVSFTLRYKTPENTTENDPLRASGMLNFVVSIESLETIDIRPIPSTIPTKSPAAVEIYELPWTS